MARLSNVLGAAIVLLAASAVAAKKAKVKMDYMIVSDDIALGPYHLKGATGTLGKYAETRPGRSRAIFEVHDGVVQTQPQKKGPNRKWKNQADIKKMYKVAVDRWVKKKGGADKQFAAGKGGSGKKAKPGKKGKPGKDGKKVKKEYIIVSDDKALGPYHLKGAKGTLEKYSKERAGRIRAIFEVHDGIVQREPQTTGGHRYWRNPQDVAKMYKVAVGQWVKKKGGASHQLPDRPAGKKIKKDYIIVSGDTAVGPYHLKGAKGTLGKYAKERVGQIRAIYEVHDGVVQREPQKTGPNRYWKTKADEMHMYRVAVGQWVKKKGGARNQLEDVKPPKKVKIEYMIVSDNDARGPYHLRGAEGTLAHFAKKHPERSRAIYEVHDGVLQKHPRNGEHNYWKDEGDIHKMYLVALGKWNKKHGKKDVKKPKKIQYITVSGDKARGPFGLTAAKARLNSWAKNARRKDKPRAIYEVHDGVVQKHPRNGKNKYWRNQGDVDDMYKVALARWNLKHSGGTGGKGKDGKPGKDAEAKTAPGPKKNMEYIIVSGDEAKGPYHLKGARGTLKSYAENPATKKYPRAIFEVHNGVVHRKPRQGPYLHAPSQDDVNNMYQVALGQWNVKRNGAKKHKMDYIVVSGGDAKGPYHLRGAKGTLKDYASKPRSKDKIRAIYEVKDGVVQREPRKSEDNYIRTPADKNKMYHIALGQWNKKNGGGSKPAPQPHAPRSVPPMFVTHQNPKSPSQYIVVSGNEASGPFKTLKGGKGELEHYWKTRPDQIRAVYEVKNGVVQKDPHYVGGQSQASGANNGFHKYWRGPKDISKMYLVAYQYWRTRGRVSQDSVEPKPPVKPAQVKPTKVYKPTPEPAVKPEPPVKPAEVKPAKVYKPTPEPVVKPEPPVKPAQSEPEKVYKPTPEPVVKPAPQPKKVVKPVGPVQENYPVQPETPEPPITPVTQKLKPRRFLVTMGDKVRGPYSLKRAKKELLKVPPGVTIPSRAIFEVKNDIVVPNPDVVGGERQSNGMGSGFNKYWKDRRDVRYMYEITSTYYMGRPPPPIPQMASAEPTTYTPPKKDTPKVAPSAPLKDAPPTKVVPRKLTKLSVASAPSKVIGRPLPSKDYPEPPPNKVKSTSTQPPNKVTAPQTCHCRVGPVGNGKCYYYTNFAERLCSARLCAPQHVCVDHDTGITCIRRRLEVRLVPYADGRCRKVPMQGFIYVPYRYSKAK